MKHTYSLFIILTLLAGGIAATYTMVDEVHPKNVTCTDKRMVAFGWTHKYVAIAELAAIAKWQLTVGAKRPGFDQWHQAYKRVLSCQKFDDSKHYQCKVSARPCRYGET